MEKRERIAVINLVCNLFYTLTSSIFPFIVKFLLVRYIGLEYLGVNSLFASILQIINIVDFNISSALSVYFYKAGAENNYKALNMYMNFIRKIYRTIGTAILLLGIAIVPFLRYIVLNGQYPQGLNIYFIYIILILHNVSSYFYVYMISLHQAFMRAYIINLIFSIGLFVSYILQIISIVFFHDYYLYTICLLASPLLCATILFISIKKRYPWLDYNENLDKEVITDIKKKVVATFLSKLRNLSRNSFDSIIISTFLGLTILARYQNYYQLIMIPLLISSAIKSSIIPVLGNSIAKETTESNLAVLNLYSLLQNAISTICVTCILSLTQPFMKFWMGAENLLPYDIVILIAIYYYVLTVSDTAAMLRETTGILWQGRYVSVIEMISNLILNIILIKFCGYRGVIIASILTVLFINIPGEFYYIFQNYFKGGMVHYFMRQTYYTCITIMIAFISYIICIKIHIFNTITLFLRIIMTILIPTSLYLLCFFRDKNFREILIICKRSIITVGTSVIHHRKV